MPGGFQLVGDVFWNGGVGEGRFRRVRARRKYRSEGTEEKPKTQPRIDVRAPVQPQGARFGKRRYTDESDLRATPKIDGGGTWVAQE